MLQLVILSYVFVVKFLLFFYFTVVVYFAIFKRSWHFINVLLTYLLTYLLVFYNVYDNCIYLSLQVGTAPSPNRPHIKVPCTKFSRYLVYLGVQPTGPRRSCGSRSSLVPRPPSRRHSTNTTSQNIYTLLSLGTRSDHTNSSHLTSSHLISYEPNWTTVHGQLADETTHTLRQPKPGKVKPI